MYRDKLALLLSIPGLLLRLPVHRWHRRTFALVQSCLQRKAPCDKMYGANLTALLSWLEAFDDRVRYTASHPARWRGNLRRREACHDILGKPLLLAA